MTTNKDTAKQLWLDCKKGNTDKVQQLLSKGQFTTDQIDSQHGDEGTTALIEACRNKDYEIVNLLVKHKAGVNKVDTRNGISPLYISCQKNDKNIAGLLLANGADVNHQNHQDKSTCCHIVTSEGYVDMLRMLLKYKSDVNLSNNRQNTPLHWAVVYKKYDIIELLIKHGADINAKNLKNKTPVTEAKDDSKILDILNNTKKHTGSIFSTSNEVPNSSSLNIPTDHSDTGDETDSSNSSPSASITDDKINTSFKKVNSLPTKLRSQYSKSSKFRPLSEPVPCLHGHSDADTDLNKLYNKIKDYIQSRYHELKIELNPEPHVDYLFSTKVLSFVDKQNIMGNHSFKSKVTERLLDTLLQQRPKEWTIELMKSFSRDNATKYMSDKFNIKAEDTDQDSSPLEKTIKENVQKNYQKLVEQIQVEPHVTFLYSKFVFNAEEIELVKTQTTEPNRVRKLLDTLYARPAFLWAAHFVESLENDEATKHFAEILKKGV